MRITSTVPASSLVLIILMGCGGDPEPVAPVVPAVTAVGTVTGPAVSMTVGAGGGMLTSADGRLSIDVPAGALGGDTELSITPITNEAPGSLPGAYRVEAGGATLLAPARVIFTYTDAMLAGTTPADLGIGYQMPDHTWEQILLGATLDETARTLTVPTDHFSDWDALVSTRLQPASLDGPIQVEVGQALPIQMVFCRYFDPVNMRRVTEQDIMDPQYLTRHPHLPREECVSSNVGSDDVEGWAVNGTAGGDRFYGTVSAIDATSATYLAPGTVPDPPVVAVSAQFIGVRGYELTYVTQLRVVGGAGTLTGGITLSTVERNSGPFDRTASWAADLVATRVGTNDFDITGTATLESWTETATDWSCAAMGGSGEVTGGLELSGDGIYTLSLSGSVESLKSCVIAGTTMNENGFFDLSFQTGDELFCNGDDEPPTYTDANVITGSRNLDCTIGADPPWTWTTTATWHLGG